MPLIVGLRGLFGVPKTTNRTTWTVRVLNMKVETPLSEKTELQFGRV